MSADALSLADRVAAPLDVARRGLLAFVGERPALARWIVARDRRVAVHASAAVLAAFAWTVLAPAAAFVLAPLAFGVPHVASDVRYLVVRRRIPRASAVVVALGSALLVAMAALELAGAAPRSAATVEMGLAWGLVATLAVAGALASRALARSLPVLGVVAALGAASFAHPTLARLAFAHLHNVAAVVVWVVLFRRTRRATLAPLLLAAAAALLVARGAVPIATLSAFGLHLYAIADVMAPGVRPDVAVALTLLFVFLQSLHYSVWLGLVPQEDLRAEGTLSFRMSLRSMVRDFGPRGLGAVAVAWAAIVALSFANVHRAREAYVALASFHGWLELAMLAYFVARGRSRATMARRA